MEEVKAWPVRRRVGSSGPPHPWRLVRHACRGRAWQETPSTRRALAIGGPETPHIGPCLQADFPSLAVGGPETYTRRTMTLYGYIRTSRSPVNDVAGSHPESQLLALQDAGVAEEHVYRDVGVSGKTATNSRHGWHALDRRLGGGTLWSSPLSTGSGAPG